MKQKKSYSQEKIKSLYKNIELKSYILSYKLYLNTKNLNFRYKIVFKDLNVRDH